MIEDKTHDSANDSDTGEEHRVDFEIAEQDKWLDYVVTRFSKDDQGAGLNRQERGGNEKDFGTAG